MTFCYQLLEKSMFELKFKVIAEHILFSLYTAIFLDNLYVLWLFTFITECNNLIFLIFHKDLLDNNCNRYRYTRSSHYVIVIFLFFFFVILYFCIVIDKMFNELMTVNCVKKIEELSYRYQVSMTTKKKNK
ncbi:LOW QUALITY PROTEIN: hypothetical protein KUTeg_004053 [Tegillarca granosa]|uniref:Uncharacterized protein n=1 Tax=Tegillarca granosa TaxID=220873 RepID=A0ABQ9FQP7_TEGGR|nr:LOW QUALITY PROTEIN: hypothetical protein KUTeg_004053 [Tegillarca granosa]